VTRKKKSPAQKLARSIQAATGVLYTVALAQAETILEALGEDEEEECGDRLTDWTCTLPPGPHPGWRHLDEESGVWWSQVRQFPFSNRIKMARGPKPDLVIVDEAVLSEGSCETDEATKERFGEETLRHMNRGKEGS
jgi:hypothetical protein